MGFAGDEASRRRVRVALIGCTGLLGDIVSRTVGSQDGFDVVAALEPEALDWAILEADIVDADIIVWNDADEATVAAWLENARATPPVLATLRDGRDAALWQLAPQRTVLGELSPITLVEAIRKWSPSSGPAVGPEA